MPPLKAQLLLEESLSAYFPEMVFTDSGITVQLHRNTHELNKTVQGVWGDLKPTETQGKKKGQPKALPVFSVHADGLLLSVET
ncbi:hypothetical protein KAM348_38510 [Aeromonas caviae]|uniref:Uncharacterized protein n=1 Tax=Aeromonas caviae TaxID=648 RepID=A0AAI9PBP0_AERCA|nr:hypothetical protein [Aeromonas caviae]GJA56428.1 hypothetical protein KAM348_38510 [Aeromonas caviae]